MGYYSSFMFTRLDGDVMAFGAAFNAIGAATGVQWFGVGVRSQVMTWYEADQHVARAMVQSRTARVVLRRDGSEQGDVVEYDYELLPDGRVNKVPFRFRLERSPAGLPEVVNIDADVIAS